MGCYEPSWAFSVGAVSYMVVPVHHWGLNNNYTCMGLGSIIVLYYPAKSMLHHQLHCIQYVTKLTHKITLLTIFSFSTSTPGPSRSSRSNGGTPFLSWPTSRIYLVICGKFLKPLKVLALSTCHVSLSFCLMLIVIVIVIAIFLGQFCPRGKGAMRLTLCKAPTQEIRPDHNTGNYVSYSFR